MKTRFFALALGLVFVTASLLAADQTSPLVTRNQDALLEVLQSNSSSRKDKADACRELAVIGDRKAVPVLAPMLADPELSHNARYALETMRGTEVDSALRDQLPKVKGRLLVGIIGSLGVRKDARAVKPLSGLLADEDQQVAQAAARALGDIGEAAGARAIEAALPKTAPANQLAFCEGLLRCAEAFAAQGKTKDAIALYDRLQKLSAAPEQVRLGAMRGSIVTRGKKTWDCSRILWHPTTASFSAPQFVPRWSFADRKLSACWQPACRDCNPTTKSWLSRRSAAWKTPSRCRTCMPWPGPAP
jgi:hypothetical protein